MPVITLANMDDAVDASLRYLKVSRMKLERLADLNSQLIIVKGEKKDADDNFNVEIKSVEKSIAQLMAEIDDESNGQSRLFDDDGAPTPEVAAPLGLVAPATESDPTEIEIEDAEDDDIDFDGDEDDPCEVCTRTSCDGCELS